MDRKTIANPANSEFTVERSRFLSFAAKADSVDDGLRFVAELKNRYPDATHAVYGINAPDGYKASDDGEPKGTGGAPVLSVLKKRKIFAAVAVVRYFGGIKLGAGGLVEAYTRAAADALDAAGEAVSVPSLIFSVRVPFRFTGAVKAEAMKRKLLSEHYAETAEFTVAVLETKDAEFLENVAEATSGKAVVEIIEKKYETY